MGVSARLRFPLHASANTMIFGGTLKYLDTVSAISTGVTECLSDALHSTDAMKAKCLVFNV